MTFIFSSLTFFSFHEFTDRVHNILIIFRLVRRGHHCLSIFHIILIRIKPHFLLILQGSCIPSVPVVSQNGAHAAQQKVLKLRFRNRLILTIKLLFDTQWQFTDPIHCRAIKTPANHSLMRTFEFSMQKSLKTPLYKESNKVQLC